MEGRELSVTLKTTRLTLGTLKHAYSWNNKVQLSSVIVFTDLINSLIVSQFFLEKKILQRNNYKYVYNMIYYFYLLQNKFV